MIILSLFNFSPVLNWEDYLRDYYLRQNRAADPLKSLKSLKKLCCTTSGFSTVKVQILIRLIYQVVIYHLVDAAREVDFLGKNSQTRQNREFYQRLWARSIFRFPAKINGWASTPTLRIYGAMKDGKTRLKSWGNG